MDKNLTEELSGTSIIKDEGPITQLRDWIKEDGSDARFRLLYRSPRDGKSGEKSPPNVITRAVRLLASRQLLLLSWVYVQVQPGQSLDVIM